ncbi:MAG: hydrolase [Parashewanella sp.]
MKKHNFVADFNPVWWARNPHVQTILPVLTKIPSPKLTRQRLELDDGDFIDLDWLKKPEENQPIVVIVHGLEGSSQSHYARRILADCQQQNIAAVVHHHRGCSGEHNRLARSYHSGDTVDLKITLKLLKDTYPSSPIWAVGYSLGGNVLAKYQGEEAEKSLIKRCVIVSAPLQLDACAKRLEKGFSKVYQSYLIKQLQVKVKAKATDPSMSQSISVQANEVAAMNTFYKMDNMYTAPMHGYLDVHDYYRRASGKQFLMAITNPTLIIHAQDDPFMNDDVIPSNNQVSSAVKYELHQRGGHVGFIESGTPWKPKYYLEKRILNFLQGSVSC